MNYKNINNKSRVLNPFLGFGWCTGKKSPKIIFDLESVYCDTEEREEL